MRAQFAVPADLSADALRRGLAPFLALASSVRGKVDLAVGTLDYPGVPLQRVRASMQLSGDGNATIRDARVTLPGQTEVGFAGELKGAGADAELRGKLTAVTENLRACAGRARGAPCPSRRRRPATRSPWRASCRCAATPGASARSSCASTPPA